MAPPDRSAFRGKMAFRSVAGAGTLLAVIGAGAAWAQSSTDANVPAGAAQKQARDIAHGEPARWLREDRTAAERLRTLLKEINAALQEAKGACRTLSYAERAACLSEARAIHQREMAEAVADAVAPGAVRTNAPVQIQ